MKKNSISLYAITLLIAFCFTPSVMAKKISYMGYQYSGKINKDNIPEGKGTITMSVEDFIDKSKTIDFSISGIFNGSNVTNAYFSTTWLSYKGDMEIKEENSFVLKKGGVITTNGYHFPGKEVSILPDAIKHCDIDVDKDTQMSYSDLVRIQMQYSYSFPEVPSKLNPPSEMTIGIGPSINGVLVRQTGSWVPSKIVYYNLEDFFKYYNSDPSYVQIFPYKDSEGRIWKFKGKELLAVEYPDGSICKKELNFERVSAQYVPKLRRTDDVNKYILLDEEIDNKPIELNIHTGYFNNWDRYFSGVDKLLEIGSSYEDIAFKIQFNASNSVRESDVDKINNFDDVIKDKLLSNISIPDNKELYIYCLSDHDITKKVKVFSVKNGVVSGRKQTAAAEKKAQQAEAAKRQANYNALCKKYGKKYVDAAVDGRIIVGMPEELLKKMYYCVLRYESGSRKKYDSADARAIIWVTNGRVSSISWY